MRRILISTKNEFNYSNINKNTRNLAIKQLATFFEGVEDKSKIKANVSISNNFINNIVKQSA